MKTVMMLVVSLLCATFVFAAGNVENGKKLFNDPSFAGSTNGRSCNSCHTGGSGLEHSGARTYTTMMGVRATSLEAVVNVCIERPLGGKALPVDSQQMGDIVAYIKSLGK